MNSKQYTGSMTYIVSRYVNFLEKKKDSRTYDKWKIPMPEWYR